MAEEISGYWAAAILPTMDSSFRAAISKSLNAMRPILQGMLGGRLARKTCNELQGALTIGCMEKTPLSKAVEILGSQSALARALGVEPQAVQQWCKRGFPPVERCAAIEHATGGIVPRRELRPDIFGEAA